MNLKTGEEKEGERRKETHVLPHPDSSPPAEETEINNNMI
jgi:hypothetical protein